MGLMGQGNDRAVRAPIEVITQSTDVALGGLVAKVARMKRESRNGKLCLSFIGPETGVGVTTLAAACGVNLARNLGISCAVVELNLREPAMARYLGLDPEPGLREYLLEEADLEQVRRETFVPTLFAVPGGRGAKTTAALLASPGFPKLQAALHESHDVLILDMPPVVLQPDVSLPLENVDGAVVVSSARRSKKRAIEETVTRLRELGAPILGMIMNRYRSDMPFGLGDPDA